MEEQTVAEEQVTQDPAPIAGVGEPSDDGGAVPEAPGGDEPDLKAERVQEE